MQRNVSSRQTDYASAQQRAVTGKRVNAPSDDPSSFAQARSETANLARAQSYERTVSLARPALETTESALNQVEDIYNRVRNIAVQGANDTLNDTDRATLSNELTGLHEQLVSLGNSTNGDRFVFAGYKDNAPPYDATGLYSGDPNVQQVEVSRGVNIPMGVTGESVFGTAGADIFTTITNLQTALTTSVAGASVSAAVSASLTEIDARFEQVRTVHSRLGNHMNALDIAEAVAGRAQDTSTKNRSSLVDIDAAQSYTDMARAQTALSAAIEIAGQLPMPGLVSRSR
ncbi:MAG: flagellar hook-filament junction protein FlgL [Pseudomonadota bacterium]